MNASTRPNIDKMWNQLVAQAKESVAKDPALAGHFHENIFQHASFADALAHFLATKLQISTVPYSVMLGEIRKCYAAKPELITDYLARDFNAVIERDPAVIHQGEPVLHQPFMFFKGFMGLQAHRVANWMWKKGRRDFALLIQSRMSEVFQVDIHPQAQLGWGIMIDHGTGVVIGQTAIVGNDCSILQGSTLGGNGKQSGKRHPTIGDGVLIGANASVLGDIEVGAKSRVAAGSVVLRDVPPNRTVAGVPGKIVGGAGSDVPGEAMKHDGVGDEPVPETPHDKSHEKHPKKQARL